MGKSEEADNEKNGQMREKSTRKKPLLESRKRLLLSFLSIEHSLCIKYTYIIHDTLYIYIHVIAYLSIFGNRQIQKRPTLSARTINLAFEWFVCNLVWNCHCFAISLSVCAPFSIPASLSNAGVRIYNMTHAKRSQLLCPQG